MLRSLIRKRDKAQQNKNAHIYMPRSLNHESEQEPRKWVYTPSSMGYEGENTTKRAAPTRKGQEHAARETKTTKVNSIMRLHIRSGNIIILIIMVITIGLFTAGPREY